MLPEAVQSGWAQLVGAERCCIVTATLDGMGAAAPGDGQKPDPFGEGTAGRQIVDPLATVHPNSQTAQRPTRTGDFQLFEQLNRLALPRAFNRDSK